MTELVDVLEQQYLDRLALRCTEWQVRNPDDAKAIRETIAQQFRIAGKPDPEPDSLRWQVFEAAVNEAIRAKAGWPTVRQWMVGKGQPAPVKSPRVTPPVVDRDDHKARASGERE
jgi:hypothetical protein